MDQLAPLLARGRGGVTERLLTARELADLLGLSAATVLDWWEDGRLPGFKLAAGTVRFRESEVLQWLESCRGRWTRKPSIQSGTVA